MISLISNLTTKEETTPWKGLNTNESPLLLHDTDQYCTLISVVESSKYPKMPLNFSTNSLISPKNQILHFPMSAAGLLGPNLVSTGKLQLSNWAVAAGHLQLQPNGGRTFHKCVNKR